MSATPQHVRIDAFSPPKVNGQMVSVRVQCGFTPLVVEAPEPIMRQIAADLLKAIGGSALKILKPKVALLKTARRDREARNLPKYIALMADMKGEPKTSMARLYIRHGISQGQFSSWCRRQKLREANARANGEAPRVVYFPEQPFTVVPRSEPKPDTVAALSRPGVCPAACAAGK